MKKLTALPLILLLFLSCQTLPVITERPNNPSDKKAEPSEPEKPQEPQAEPVIHFSGGRGTPDNPWLIATREDLDSVSRFCNAGTASFLTDAYVQTADLDFAGGRLETIGNCVARYFKGRYDGGGHSISHVSFFTTYSDAGGTGLFGYTSEGADIRNIVLKEARNEAAYGNSAAFVARMDGGCISACRAEASVQVIQTSANGHNTGGIVGYARNASRVSSCIFEGSIVGECHRIGGVAGAIGGTAVIENCTFKGSISSQEGCLVGGIAGWVTAGSIVSSTSEGCSIEAKDTLGGIAGLVSGGSVVNSRSRGITLKGNKYIGGIAGYLKAYGISGCRVDGNTGIDSYSGECGGIAGYVWGTGVSDCHFDQGVITGGGRGRHKFGGIAGTVYGSAAAVTGCSCSGTMNTSAGILGGIAGLVSNNSIVSSCTVTASAGITSVDFNIVGGVAGQVESGGMVNKCWCCAPVVSKIYVGGIAGYVTGSGSTVANCAFYSSSVTGDGSDTSVGGIVGKMDKSGCCVNACSIPTVIGNGSQSSGAVCGAYDSTCSVTNCYGTVGGTAGALATLNSQALLYNNGNPRIRAASWVNGTIGYPVIEGCPVAGGTSGKTKVGVMGDSISTCKGWTPYPLGYGYLNKKEWTDITSPAQLYWYQLIYEKMSNAELDINTAYSGTAVSLTVSKGHPGYSFLQRIGDLENPDVILLNGGTNDAGFALPIGEYAFDKPVEELDGYLFAQAYDKLVRQLKARWPQVKIVCIITDYLNRRPDYARVVKDVAARYSLPCAVVDYGEDCAKYTEDDDGDGVPDLLHPNAPGMKRMAEQIWEQIKDIV